MQHPASPHSLLPVSSYLSFLPLYTCSPGSNHCLLQGGSMDPPTATGEAAAAITACHNVLLSIYLPYVILTTLVILLLQR